MPCRLRDPLEAVAQQDCERQALALLVRAGRRLGREHATQLVQHPVAGRIEALQMLLGTARHGGVLQ